MDAAFQRLYRDGFRNVAIDQVLADAGISGTAFHKHFDCKKDLLLAALGIASGQQGGHSRRGEEVRRLSRRGRSRGAGRGTVPDHERSVCSPSRE